MKTLQSKSTSICRATLNCILIFALVLCFTSCSDEEDEPVNNKKEEAPEKVIKFSPYYHSSDSKEEVCKVYWQYSSSWLAITDEVYRNNDCIHIISYPEPKVTTSDEWLNDYTFSEYKISRNEYNLKINIGSQGNSDKVGYYTISNGIESIRVKVEYHKLGDNEKKPIIIRHDHREVVIIPDIGGSGSSGGSGNSGGSSNTDERDCSYVGSTTGHTKVADKIKSQTIYIYKRNSNGELRASTQYSQKGLVLGATYNVKYGTDLWKLGCNRYFLASGIATYFKW